MRATLALPILALLLTGCSDPAPEYDRKMAFKTEKSDPVLGLALFNANCKACHGSGALGSKLGPPLIHRIYEPGHHADFSFYRAVKNGVRGHHWNFGDMPPVPAVSVEQAGHIIAYIRQQQRLAGIE
ncbi:MAG: cytochrome c [Mariprofundaceae bacterium]|nr:cytochrome c [Mariprofundaceae bacterium]